MALIVHGRDMILVPWSDLIALRDLTADVPAEAAYNGDYERIECGSWAASGSTFGIALMHDGAELCFEAEEWEELQALLHVGDDLLLITEVAELAGCSRQLVGQAIWRGALFALQMPDMERRQWRIPRTAAEKWIESRDQ
jgi:hypothetical protein